MGSARGIGHYDRQGKGMIVVEAFAFPASSRNADRPTLLNSREFIYGVSLSK
jgi:hypothetical protein